MAVIIARFWSHFAFQMLLQMFKQASRLGYQGYQGKIGLSGLSRKDWAIRAIRARLGYRKIGLSGQDYGGQATEGTFALGAIEA